MNIFDFAMDLEREGEVFYRNLAEKTPNTGLKNILNMLADAEVEHYEIFKRMKHDEKVQIPDTKIIGKAKNIFLNIKETSNFKVDITSIDLYKKAQELEKKSEEYYINHGKESEDLKLREILYKIASEEQNHYYLLENIIEFVSRPQQWVENAEFSQLKDY